VHIDRTGLGFIVTEMSRASEPVVPDPFIAALRPSDPPDRRALARWQHTNGPGSVTVAECRSRAGSAAGAAT
jgi:hypothetical protein